MKQKTPRVKLTHVFLATAIILTAVGTVFVFESSLAESLATFGNQFFLLKQHLFGLAVGLVAFLIGVKTPTSFWLKYSKIWFCLSLLLLVLVFVPGIGKELNGAHRWLSIGGLRLQPVEFLKLSIVLYYAHWLKKHQNIASFLIVTAVPLVLIMLQPDLGSALIVTGLALTMFFLGGGNLKKIGLIAAVGMPLLVASIALSPYRLQRVTTFLNPESDPLGASFHARQNTLALGRGGILGKGFGNSNQKFNYVPEASTDSIFAIVAEEVGLVGSLVIFVLFGTFFYCIYAIAQKESDKEHRVLLMGIMTWIGLQTVLNLGAVVALVPLTGTPLPFFSYGRSSQVMILFATGLVVRRSLKA